MSGSKVDRFRADLETPTPKPVSPEHRYSATRQVAELAIGPTDAALVLLRLGLVDESGIKPYVLHGALALDGIDNHHEETA